MNPTRITESVFDNRALEHGLQSPKLGLVAAGIAADAAVDNIVVGPDRSAALEAWYQGGGRRKISDLGETYVGRAGGYSTGRDTVHIPHATGTVGHGDVSKVYINNEIGAKPAFAVNLELDTATGEWRLIESPAANVGPGAAGAVFENFYCSASDVSASNDMADSPFFLIGNSASFTRCKFGYGQTAIRQPIKFYLDGVYFSFPEFIGQRAGTRAWIELEGPGDGIVIDRPHAILSYPSNGDYSQARLPRVAHLANKAGVAINEAIGCGNFRLRNILAATGKGGHFENGGYEIEASSAFLFANAYWMHGSSSGELDISPVRIRDNASKGNISPSIVTFTDEQFVYQQDFQGGFDGRKANISWNMTPVGTRFTGSIVGDMLTVTNFTSGKLGRGSPIILAGAAVGTVDEVLTGYGWIGTYRLSNPVDVQAGSLMDATVGPRPRASFRGAYRTYKAPDGSTYTEGKVGLRLNDPTFNAYSHIASIVGNYSNNWLEMNDTLGELPAAPTGLISAVTDASAGIWRGPSGRVGYKVQYGYDFIRGCFVSTPSEIFVDVVTGGPAVRLIFDHPGRCMVRTYRSFGGVTNTFTAENYTPMIAGNSIVDLGNLTGFGDTWIERPSGAAQAPAVSQILSFTISPSEDKGSTAEAYGNVIVRCRSSQGAPGLVGSWKRGDLIEVAQGPIVKVGEYKARHGGWKRITTSRISSPSVIVGGAGVTGTVDLEPIHHIISFDGPGVRNDDADYTVTPRADSVVQRHVGVLTAVRTVTLDAAAARDGDKFRFTRTGGGAFNLSIGGLKNLAQNTWCEVLFVFNVGWVLTQYGTL